MQNKSPDGSGLTTLGLRVYACYAHTGRRVLPPSTSSHSRCRPGSNNLSMLTRGYGALRLHHRATICRPCGTLEFRGAMRRQALQLSRDSGTISFTRKRESRCAAQAQSRCGEQAQSRPPKLSATADNFTAKFGCRLTVKNGVAVVKNSLRSW